MLWYPDSRNIVCLVRAGGRSQISSGFFIVSFSVNKVHSNSLLFFIFDFLQVSVLQYIPYVYYFKKININYIGGNLEHPCREGTAEDSFITDSCLWFIFKPSAEDAGVLGEYGKGVTMPNLNAIGNRSVVFRYGFSSSSSSSPSRYGPHLSCDHLCSRFSVWTWCSFFGCFISCPEVV